MVVVQNRLSLLQYWHSLWTQEGTDHQLPRALFCFLNSRTTKPNLNDLTQPVYPVFLKRAKRKVSQRGQRAQLGPGPSESIIKTYTLCWCSATITIGATPVSAALGSALGLLHSGWRGLRDSREHGLEPGLERENRENLERDKILSNFYMFCWRYKTLHLI